LIRKGGGLARFVAVAKTLGRLAGAGGFQAADLAVPEAVVAEGEDLAGDGDAGDSAAAAFGDSVELFA
jgi:hypothetical protein